MVSFSINNAYFLERFTTKRMTLLFRNIFLRKKTVLITSFLLLFLLLTIKQGITQDVHLTQFNYSPLLLNAANTGNFYGDWRVGLNYRNQWASTGTPYNTMVFSGDKLFSIYNQKIGAGALIISDQSNGVNRTKVYASGSYFNDLKENHLSIGIQAGMVFTTPGNFDWKIYNPITDSPDIPNDESGTTEKSKYVDINLGILWRRSIGIFEPEVGIAYAHLNKPNESLMVGTSLVNPTTTIHASAKTNINDEIYVLPTFLIATNSGSTLSVIGTDVGYNLLGNRSSVKKIFGGIYVRNGLADELSDLSLLLGVTVGRLDIAINYDINLSSLSQNQSVSTFEISLIYKSLSTILNSYSIPCERF